MIIKRINKIPLSFLQLSNLCTSRQCSSPHVKSSTILSNLFKFGRTRYAEKLFDGIPEKTVVSWSIMIHGYAKNGFNRKSLELFTHMRMSGLVPNSFTMVGVLVSIVGLKDLLLAQCVHGLIVKNGLEFNPIVSTAMLDAYARCGNVYGCYEVFEGIKNPGLVSCNAIIAGFVYNGLFEEAASLFNRFQKIGLVPNATTFTTLLQAYVALESRGLCDSLYGLVVKFGLGLDTLVNNSVLDMYSSLMDLDAATRIFDGMEFKDVISWTTMMSLLIRLEYVSDAVELFHRMRHIGVDLDAVVIMNLISACAILGDVKRGQQIHAQAVVCGFGSDLPLANSFIAMYSKCGDFDSSRTVFSQTTEKSLVSWSAMISGFVHNGRPVDALNLLIKSRLEENFFLDSVILVVALTASGEISALEVCQQLHCYAFSAGFSLCRTVQNRLISTYSKCGNVEFAHIVFNELHYLQNSVSWNAILNGYGINGHGETALALYHEMRKRGEDPDSATYLCILSACGHAGLVNDGLLIFNQMVVENRITPSQEHYGCLVDLLARAGFLLDANVFASKFLEGAGSNVWKPLLSGCLLHGNMELAEFAARRLFKQDQGESGLVLLSNIYASFGRFQDAEALRLSIQKKGLVKNPGVSVLSGMSYDFG